MHKLSTGSWHLLLSLRKGKIIELLSVALGQFLGLFDLFHNLIDLFGDLASLQFSFRSLLALGKEGDVLLEPSSGVF